MPLKVSNSIRKFSDSLVYQYLMEIGSLETAEEFRRERKDCTDNPIILKDNVTFHELLKG